MMKLLHKLIYRNVEAIRAGAISLGCHSLHTLADEQLFSRIWNCANVCEVTVCPLYLSEIGLAEALVHPQGHW